MGYSDQCLLNSRPRFEQAVWPEPEAVWPGEEPLDLVKWLNLGPASSLGWTTCRAAHSRPATCLGTPLRQLGLADA